MNKFEDYNSSQITPQYTLLKKFYELIKFLKENPTYNVYYSSEDYSSEITSYDVINVNLRNHELKSGDLIVFKNGYAGFTDAVGDNNFTVLNGLYIIGPQGIQGETGPQGPQGIQGEQGEKGETGADGSSVRILPNAESCVNLGDGYLDNSGHLQVLSNLSPRTFTDVGEIRGPQGIQGETGPQGPQGAQGIQGIQGETGPQGPAGQNGTNGTNGTDGISITNVAVNSSNHLIVTLSNSQTIDAGEIQVNNEQIIYLNTDLLFYHNRLVMLNLAGIKTALNDQTIDASKFNFIVNIQIGTSNQFTSSNFGAGYVLIYSGSEEITVTLSSKLVMAIKENNSYRIFAVCNVDITVSS